MYLSLIISFHASFSKVPEKYLPMSATNPRTSVFISSGKVVSTGAVSKLNAPLKWVLLFYMPYAFLCWISLLFHFDAFLSIYNSEILF